MWSQFLDLNEIQRACLQQLVCYVKLAQLSDNPLLIWFFNNLYVALAPVSYKPRYFLFIGFLELFE